MAESLVHQRLVEQIVSYLQAEYEPLYQLAIFHDLPAFIGAEKPPRIGGFVPDVYAVDAPRSITILGEAKTEYDLATDHSHRQLSAYFTFLRLQPCGVLVLAVPWQAKARSLNLVKRLQQTLECSMVRTAVITGVAG